MSVNLIKDPQFLSLAEFLTDESSLVFGGIQNVISNSFLSNVTSYLSLTSLSEPLFFSKDSPQNVNNGFGLDDINKNDVLLSFRYNSNDIQAVTQNVMFPIDITSVNPKSYYNNFFTLSVDVVSTFANINNQSLTASLVFHNGTGWETLGRTSFNVWTNNNFNLSSHPNFKLFKKYKLLFKTVKKSNSTLTSASYTNTSFSDRPNQRMFLVIQFPNIGSTYNVNLANLGLFLGKVDNVLIAKSVQTSMLETKTKLIATKIITNNLTTTTASVTSDFSVGRDLSVSRNATVSSDLRVVGVSKLGTEVQFLSNTNLVQGRITKVGQLASSKFTFLNGDGTRGELDAISLQARYADVGEFHKCSNDCEVGDLVQVSSSKDYDIEKCSDFKKAIGVISNTACLKMNNGLLDLPENENFKVLVVGYLGIIDVKIKGKICKGDSVSLSSIKGIGKKSFFKTNIKALDSNNMKSIKVIRCLVQF